MRSTGLRAALVAVLVLPVLLPAEASQVERELPVHFGFLGDVALLRPYDPRSDDLLAREGAMGGMWTGELRGSGGLVRLVEMRGAALALVEVAPRHLAWATVSNGALVPLVVPDAHVGSVDTELAAPAAEGASAASSDASGDGKVQLFVDGDSSFRAEYGTYAGQYQLALLALVDAIYDVNLGVEVEVVEQHVWTEVGPFTGPIRCNGASDDLLQQFRSHYESIRPTTSDAREESLILTSKPPVPHPNGGTLIGCGYIYELESPYAYASARVAGSLGVSGNRYPLPAGMATHVLLIAHEMGHNFGGLHERAFPPPGVGSCIGSTIMFPYLCQNQPLFSDAHGIGGPFESSGLMEDGGNAPWMRSYAQSRL